MKNSLFAAALGAAVVLAPTLAPSLALAEEEAETRRAPRIIYGQSAGATFEFDTRPAPRRKGNVNRQAYFGSGAAYDEALAGLRRSLQRMTARIHSQAQAPEAAPSPALRRALTLARQAREDGSAAN